MEAGSKGRTNNWIQSKDFKLLLHGSYLFLSAEKFVSNIGQMCPFFTTSDTHGFLSSIHNFP